MEMMKLLFLVLQIFLSVVKSTILPSIIWDPRNKIFENKADCNDEYARIFVDLSSELYFICPSIVLTSSVLQNAISKNMLYENMYIVSKEEFENCRVNKLTDTTKKFLACDSPKNPLTVKYKRIYFSAFGPSDRISFKPGQTYYFIATSNGTESGLNRFKGGRCKTHNMRLAITICNDGQNCYNEAPKCSNPIKPEETTTTTTPAPKVIIPDKTVQVVAPLPDAAPRKTEEPDGDSGHDSATLVYGIIGGIVCGLLLGACVAITAQKYFQKKKEESAKNNQEVFTVAEHVDPVETLRREANRKYFSEENPEYRNSTEFKRLLSTSSGCSSERYSVVKVNE